jgi:hypothetical protein
MLTCTLNNLSFTCYANGRSQMNVGTYNDTSFSLLLLYINIYLSIIIPPMFHTHLSAGASSCTVHQFPADLAYQGLQFYSTTEPSSADNMLRLCSSFFCGKFRFQTERNGCSLHYILLFKKIIIQFISSRSIIGLLGICYIPSCRKYLLIVLKMALKQSDSSCAYFHLQ